MFDFLVVGKVEAGGRQSDCPKPGSTGGVSSARCSGVWTREGGIF